MNIHAAEIGPRSLYEHTRRCSLADNIAIKSLRRLELGELGSLLFESRETVLFELHELIRAHSHWGDAQIREAICEQQYLLPQSGVLTATFMLHCPCPQRSARLCETLAKRPETTLKLCIAERTAVAEPIDELGVMPCPVQYFRFHAGNDLSFALRRSDEAAYVRIATDEGEREFPLQRSLRHQLAAQLDDYGQPAPLHWQAAVA